MKNSCEIPAKFQEIKVRPLQPIWSWSCPAVFSHCNLFPHDFLSHRFTGIEACLYLRRNFVFDFYANKQFEA